MFKRSQEQLQAVATVMRAPGGKVLWEMLLAMAVERDREARKLEGPALYRAQGAAEAYEQLAKDMAESVTRRHDAIPKFNADRQVV